MNNLSFDRYLEKEIKREPGLRLKLDKIKNAMDIAFQIYELRKNKNLTQKALSKITGISQPNIARLERADYRNYSIKTLEKIAIALNVTFKFIFTPINTNTNNWIITPRTCEEELFRLDQIDSNARETEESKIQEHIEDNQQYFSFV